MARAVIPLIAAMMLATQASASVADPAFGRWLVESGKAIIEIGPCAGSGGAKACGRIVWLQAPLDENGALKVDGNNPDPALRVRPLCGLELIGGFERDAPGSWSDGWIYNARDGEVYDARLSVEEGGKLEVRGYVGITLLGSSQYWTPVEDDAGGCPG